MCGDDLGIGVEATDLRAHGDRPRDRTFADQGDRGMNWAREGRFCGRRCRVKMAQIWQGKGWGAIARVDYAKCSAEIVSDCKISGGGLERG